MSLLSSAVPNQGVIPAHHDDSQQCDIITVSSSPIKGTLDIWIAKSGLYLADKSILESAGWLPDNIIVAVQNLLKLQTSGRIVGWQSTQLSKREKMFDPIPLGVPFVQILNVNGDHWITTSNLMSTSAGSIYNDRVCVYDSNWSVDSKLELTTIKNVCSFLKESSFQLCGHRETEERVRLRCLCIGVCH